MDPKRQKTENSPNNRKKPTVCPLSNREILVKNLGNHMESIRCHNVSDICDVGLNSTEFMNHHRIPIDFSEADFKDFDTLNYEPACLNVIRKFYHSIKTKVTYLSKLDIYNFSIDIVTPSKLIHYLDKIFQHSKNAFEMNISFGLVLKYFDTGQFIYSPAAPNSQTAFEKPKIVRSITEKDTVIESLKCLTFEDVIRKSSSKWMVYAITNVTYYVRNLKALMGLQVTLPPHLYYCKGICSLVKNRRGQSYSDNKSFFRCLALHQGHHSKGLESAVNMMVQDYCIKASIRNFVGVNPLDLEKISELFQVGIQVYEQNESKETKLLFKSVFQSENPLCMNLYQKHFSYIKDMEIYSSIFKCSKCDTIFNKSYNCQRHFNICRENKKQVYLNIYIFNIYIIFILYCIIMRVIHYYVILYILVQLN